MEGKKIQLQVSSSIHHTKFKLSWNIDSGEPAITNYDSARLFRSLYWTCLSGLVQIHTYRQSWVTAIWIIQLCHLRIYWCMVAMLFTKVKWVWLLWFTLCWVVWHYNCEDRPKILELVWKSRFLLLCKWSQILVASANGSKRPFFFFFLFFRMGANILNWKSLIKTNMNSAPQWPIWVRLHQVVVGLNVNLPF